MYDVWNILTVQAGVVYIDFKLLLRCILELGATWPLHDVRW